MIMPGGMMLASTSRALSFMFTTVPGRVMPAISISEVVISTATNCGAVTFGRMPPGPSPWFMPGMDPMSEVGSVRRPGGPDRVETTGGWS